MVCARATEASKRRVDNVSINKREDMLHGDVKDGEVLDVGLVDRLNGILEDDLDIEDVDEEVVDALELEAEDVEVDVTIIARTMR